MKHVIWAGTVLMGCVVSSFVVSAARAADDRTMAKGIVKAEFIYEKAPFPECHASTLVEIKGGLLAAWFGGTEEGHKDVTIWMSRYDGRSWSPPVEAATGKQDDGKQYPCWNPVLFQPKNGPLTLFYKVGPSPSRWWGMRIDSTDDGKTWSKPERIPDGLLGPVKNKPIQLADGTILAGSSTEHDGWRLHIERSVDGGKKFAHVGPLNDGKEFSAIQPTVLAWPGGAIQILCRSRQDRIVESWSTDGGRSWGKVRKTEVLNPNSGIDAVMLADGRAALVYNPTTRGGAKRPREREMLAVATSVDGKSWQPWVTLESQRGEYSYPAVIQTADGMIHATYTYDRKQVKHVVLDPSKADVGPTIAGVREKMSEFVAQKEIAGAVTLVASRDRVLHLDAVGSANVADNVPMRHDTIFWIASMTKPITGTAVMMMIEEGKIGLDDLVEKHIPEFAKLKMKDGTAAKVTVRQLLTHSSGMSDVRNEDVRGIKTLAELMPIYVDKPVQFTPGSKWSYCQSSINTAARLVEVASGKSFVDFLEERLFGPLGMKDTTFYLSEAQHARLSKSYARTKEGELVVAQNFLLAGAAPTSRDRFPAANGGLFSTAGDYARFCQMILNKGEFANQRILKPESVATMTSVLSGDLATGFTPGNGWGLGFCVVRKPQGVTGMLGEGACGHGGAFGTQAWIDVKNDRAYVLMVQRANFPNADASEVRKVFQEMAAKK